MIGRKQVIGYYTEDGNIYCPECINNDREIMEKIEKIITAKDSEEIQYFCQGCEKEIK